MALKAEQKKQIASLLKIKEADLDKAITDEAEVELAIPEGLNVLTAEELETRDETQKKLGEKAGREIGIKEVKKAAGLPEDAPSKDPVKVAQAIVEKATKDAKIEPNEKVTQLTDQVGLLQKQLGEKDTEIEGLKTTASQASLDRKILSAFPKNRATTLNEDEYLTLLKGGYKFTEQDGKIVVEKDGKPMRDSKTTDFLPVSEALTQIFTERKWISEGEQTPGGRGGSGGAGGNGKYTKLSEIKAEFDKQGKSTLGEEFSNAVAKAAKDNADFKMGE